MFLTRFIETIRKSSTLVGILLLYLTAIFTSHFSLIYISRNFIIVYNEKIPHFSQSSTLVGILLLYITRHATGQIADIYISRNSIVIYNTISIIRGSIIYISRNLIMYKFYIYIVTYFLFFINCSSYLYISKKKAY